METHNFSDAKVGDLVSNPTFGHGKIQLIDRGDVQIHCIFGAAIISFTKDGKWLDDYPQSLYHGHVDFKIETIEPCPYEVGEWIAVRNNISHAWEIAEFEFVNHEGRICASGIKWVYHASLSSFNQSK